MFIPREFLPIELSKFTWCSMYFQYCIITSELLVFMTRNVNCFIPMGETFTECRAQCKRNPTEQQENVKRAVDELMILVGRSIGIWQDFRPSHSGNTTVIRFEFFNTSAGKPSYKYTFFFLILGGLKHREWTEERQISKRVCSGHFNESFN